MGTFGCCRWRPVTGHRLALTGSSLDAGAACTATLSNGADPVRRRARHAGARLGPVPYAIEYRVHVSRDADFTTRRARRHPAAHHEHPLGAALHLPLQGAAGEPGPTPYYWFIQPCKSATQCGPDPNSTVNPSRHAFRKTSPQVQLVARRTGAAVDATEVTFEWRTTTTPTRPRRTPRPASRATSRRMRYRSRSTTTQPSPRRSTMSASTRPTYTADRQLYPEGPLWWRVRAVDAEGNALAWSASRTFTKSSPAPVLTSPVEDGGQVPVVTGAVPFRWQALPFAGGYDIQVAANDDHNFSAVNLKVNTIAKRSAFTTGSTVFPIVPTLQASDSPTSGGCAASTPTATRAPGPPSASSRSAAAADACWPPAPAPSVGPRGLVLRWGAVAEASKYRVELRTLGTTSRPPRPTPATVLGPADGPDGRHDLRVARGVGRRGRPLLRPGRLAHVHRRRRADGHDARPHQRHRRLRHDPRRRRRRRGASPDVSNTYQWRRTGSSRSPGPPDRRTSSAPRTSAPPSPSWPPVRRRSSAPAPPPAPP